MKEHMEVKINKLKQKICMFVYVCVPEERQRLCPGKTVYKCETRLLNLTFSAQWGAIEDRIRNLKHPMTQRQLNF